MDEASKCSNLVQRLTVATPSAWMTIFTSEGNVVKIM